MVINGLVRQYHTFRYTRRFGVIGVDALLETSRDLAAWSDASDDFVVTSTTLNGNGTETITLRKMVPISVEPSGAHYYRLRMISSGS